MHARPFTDVYTIRYQYKRKQHMCSEGTIQQIHFWECIHFPGTIFPVI